MAMVTRGAVAPPATTTQLGQAERDQLDTQVRAVAAKASEWARLAPSARADLLSAIMADTLAAADAWSADACRAKGLAPGSAEAGEELFSGVGTFLRMARVMRESIQQIAKHGAPKVPGPFRTAPDGRLIAQVLPAGTFDKLFYAKTTGEVWMEPGVTEASCLAGLAPAYRDPEAHAGLSLVLGAGNVASLGPRDVLSKLFVEGKVVIMKANPVNEYLVPHWERAMASLIEAGYLTIVRGGAEVGQFLTNHEAVAEIHVTGSDKTHDAIVFGTGPEGEARRAADTPLLDKPMTCELGSVSPVLVVPGTWTDAEIKYQAEHVATMLANNAGFNCLTPRVIVTWAGWEQREQFLAALHEILEAIPTRDAYYPGARDRWQSFIDQHPNAVQIGEATATKLPWTVVEDVNPAELGDICLNVEAFCSLTSVTALEAADEEAFVKAAVAFCNDVVWGTLSCTVLACDASMADPKVGPAVEQAVADLRYGSIGVNLWHAMSFAFGTTTWGAYPGHARNDIQSGSGVVGNAFMFDRPQKSVVRGPFTAKPKPAWFATNAGAAKLMPKMLAFEARPSWAKVPGLILASLKG